MPIILGLLVIIGVLSYLYYIERKRNQSYISQDESELRGYVYATEQLDEHFTIMKFEELKCMSDVSIAGHSRFHEGIRRKLKEVNVEHLET